MTQIDPRLFAAFAPGFRITPIAGWGFVLLMAMVGVWFISISWLFHRLRSRHASVYEAIGSPSLFWNNSPRSGFLFLRFLYSSGPRELDDRTALRVISFLRVFVILYFVGFFALILLVWSGGPRP